jgi:hypothetical protein
MLHAKQTSTKRKGGSKSGAAFGVAGVSHEINLREEEVSGVSLATFHVFGKETAAELGEGLARRNRGGCGGCGCSH